MGNVLERSGIAEAFYETIHLWMGRLNGGLAIASVIVCTFMAAMVGVIAAGIVTMGIIALPAMLNRDYDKHMAAGSIMAGGGTGVTYPPQRNNDALFSCCQTVSGADVYGRDFSWLRPFRSILHLYSHKMCSTPENGSGFTTRSQGHLEGEICLTQRFNPARCPHCSGSRVYIHGACHA